MVDYRGKLVLAPMVRAGELPTRLLALKHGADLVWGPEIIDKKLISCDRIENKKLGTIDYLSKGQTRIPGITNLVFRTHPPSEESKLIFQMGTSNTELAVQAANLIIKDVSGIDINAGCPKHFSIHAGMGAALLKTPDLLCDILKNLVEKVGIPNGKPISVKIRLFAEESESLALIERLVKTGITNLTVHCRTQPMRNREKPIRFYIDKIKKICDDNKVSLIINGALTNREDFLELQKSWGSDVGGMIATEAEINPTCFSLKPLHWVSLIKEYTHLAEKYDNYVGNTKYMLTRMVPGKNPLYQIVTKSKTYEEFYQNFELVNDDGTLKKDIQPVALNNQLKKNAKVEPREQSIKVETSSNNNNDKKHKLVDTSDSTNKRNQVAAVNV